MLRIIILVSLSAISSLTCIQGQTFGTPEWSNVPFTDNGKVPWAVYGPYCVDGVSFALASIVVMKDDYVRISLVSGENQEVANSRSERLAGGERHL